MFFQGRDFRHEAAWAFYNAWVLRSVAERVLFIDWACETLCLLPSPTAEPRSAVQSASQPGLSIGPPCIQSHVCWYLTTANSHAYRDFEGVFRGSVFCPYAQIQPILLLQKVPHVRADEEASIAIC